MPPLIEARGAIPPRSARGREKKLGRPRASKPEALLVVFGRGKLRLGDRTKIEALLNERAANGEANGKVRVYRLTPVTLTTSISLKF